MILFHQNGGAIEISRNIRMQHLYYFPDDLLSRPGDAMKATCTDNEVDAAMKIREAQANPGKWV